MNESELNSLELSQGNPGSHQDTVRNELPLKKMATSLGSGVEGAILSVMFDRAQYNTHLHSVA